MGTSTSVDAQKSTEKKDKTEKAKSKKSKKVKDTLKAKKNYEEIAI
ncbi:MAG: hypothetical protein P8H42_10825 [Saprospiraceae bacterium]|nr:hypothetical protein [Saprospiraceae bacterium]